MPPLLSICIPSYNGQSHIGKLLESLAQCDSREFEVVVSDDCSVDGTWEFLQEFSTLDSRVRVFRNDLNCGMDRNFTRSVELAEGDFVWLCGQDDVIAPNGVATVIRAIKAEHRLDFIHMTHVMMPDIPVQPEWSLDKQELGASGVGLKDFLDTHNQKLPTFLPEYVIRRALWQKVDATRYFGTCYCQVGVFLEMSNAMKWHRIQECHVMGLLPQNGWQTNGIKYSNIIFGYFVMLNRALQINPAIGRDFVNRQYHLHCKQLLYAVLLMRAWSLESRVSLIEEARAALYQSPVVYHLFESAMHMPPSVCRIILMAVKIKRAISIKNKVQGWRFQN
ncbi:glycosyltransferase family 2 protein [Laribacter hongkongensis]|uniref:Glycosyl transferase n=1 Tax=Laribacter hongkongensis TaxID=168471 RepID=A0A248LLM0_9NEIS|nr:glycosyltransferase family 2 protein [Laribacter hongkongensis]ASJ25638.1 glycosyl transferase [Laribacter hongkongensis]MCG9040723.1 glycosyltransferase [Laribacter hongkongensis]MCG9056241.1 glycosyltransferase [Laribacter hongkongensis]MCG9067879.1 glycosyltransferase [Laribacter hongkongensis]MCG9087443.1 glycosyltransferase [Laribacter hongkongensis]